MAANKAFYMFRARYATMLFYFLLNLSKSVGTTTQTVYFHAIFGQILLAILRIIK